MILNDIVGLYMNPSVNALVFCMDEKSQIQALDRTKPSLPLGPEVPARQSHDYERHGITSLFTALNAKSFSRSDALTAVAASHCPKPPDAQPAASGGLSRLGLQLDIRQVAALIGCSPWSIRNTWVPRGLPIFAPGRAAN